MYAFMQATGLVNDHGELEISQSREVTNATTLNPKTLNFQN
jgi:hypothetical protein